MNNITLVEEDEGGVDIEETEYVDEMKGLPGFDIHLCLVGRFINERVIYSYAAYVGISLEAGNECVSRKSMSIDTFSGSITNWI